MRRVAKTDRNHAEITKALRDIGASVQTLHQVGGGCPDLLIGYRGRTLLLEVKDGCKPPSAQRLTADEAEWHAKWGGQVAIVSSPEQAQTTVIRESMR